MKILVVDPQRTFIQEALLMLAAAGGHEIVSVEELPEKPVEFKIIYDELSEMPYFGREKTWEQPRSKNNYKLKRRR